MIAELHCTQNRNKVQEHYVQKTGEKPNADREHIFYFNNFFFLLSHRTKEPVTLPSNHVVEHGIVRILRTYLDDEDGMKV